MCYGVVQEPVKCTKCETMYCKKCIPQNKYSCFMKCGASTTTALGRIERNILNNLTFRCQHSAEFQCEAVLKYENYKKHL